MLDSSCNYKLKKKKKVHKPRILHFHNLYFICLKYDQLGFFYSLIIIATGYSIAWLLKVRHLMYVL